MPTASEKAPRDLVHQHKQGQVPDDAKTNWDNLPVTDIQFSQMGGPHIIVWKKQSLPCEWCGGYECPWLQYQDRTHMIRNRTFWPDTYEYDFWIMEYDKLHPAPPMPQE